MAIMESVLNNIDVFVAWISSSLQQSTDAYIELETADSPTVLVNHDGSLLSIIRISGVKELVGDEEFNRILENLNNSLHTLMTRPGYSMQVLFTHDSTGVKSTIDTIYGPAKQTAENLNLDVKDLFDERRNFISQYCNDESLYFAFWTHPESLAGDQLKAANKDKVKVMRDEKIPAFTRAQNIMAVIPELRDSHDAFIRTLLNDFSSMNIHAKLLSVHEAVHAVRSCADPDFTDAQWRATLPGDRLPVMEVNQLQGELSDILWPSLAKQVLPRDASNIDMKTVRYGDKIYSTVFIDLFPKEIRSFMYFFQRILNNKIPWRMSYLLKSEGLSTLRFKSSLATILSFSSAYNRLLSDSNNLLNYLRINTDEALVKYQVCASTWAPVGEINLLRSRVSELAKALQGWGGCEISENCGDAFAGMVSTSLALSTKSVAPSCVAPLSDVVFMLPISRPASQWRTGALMFRTPDGKLWPYQPGSSEQTTWIDLVYARPGSGKSVLSNAINLALCLSGGLARLPRIAIIDIGPSSSGLISLLKEALPPRLRHLAVHHRLRMTPEYSINPFDTQLGCRYPNPAERAFLVNFLTLLATPLGSDRAYDGVADLAGMVVNELYRGLADDANPHTYSEGIEPFVDAILEEIGFVGDLKTTWWEVVDALFGAGFILEAHKAQRYAMPLLADAASVCRLSSVEDLYGKIITPTSESLIDAFARMISSAVREYPILSRVTHFDIGEAKVVALDLDEVAKSGGDAADRQTAVMYMLARYVFSSALLPY